MVIYDPLQVAKIIETDSEFYGRNVDEAVRATSEEGTNGELLGFGVRSMWEANLSVRFIDEFEETRGGFQALEGEHMLFVNERAQDYRVGLGVNWRIDIRPLAR